MPEFKLLWPIPPTRKKVTNWPDLFEVHNNLGKGFSEIACKDALECGFKNSSLAFEREKEFSAAYKDTYLMHKLLILIIGFVEKTYIFIRTNRPPSDEVKFMDSWQKNSKRD